MNENVLHYVIEALAGLTVAAITGTVSALVANARGRKAERKRINKAPMVYVDGLGKLIDVAVDEGPEKAKLNARAIVSARNSLARSLVSVSSTLNSEIDRLAVETGEPVLRRGELINDAAFGIANEDIYNTILVLHRVWPSRRAQMIMEIRKLFAELGLSLDATGEEPPISEAPSRARGAGA